HIPIEDGAENNEPQRPLLDSCSLFGGNNTVFKLNFKRATRPRGPRFGGFIIPVCGNLPTLVSSFLGKLLPTVAYGAKSCADTNDKRGSLSVIRNINTDRLHLFVCRDMVGADRNYYPCSLDGKKGIRKFVGSFRRPFSGYGLRMDRFQSLQGNTGTHNA